MMTVNVLFAARRARWKFYADPLPAAIAAAGVAAHVALEIPPQDVDYIVYAPDSPLQDFRPYTRTKAVLSLWAGVEEIVGNETLVQPLTRMVDGGLKEGMVEWVTGHVLRHHLGMDAHIVNPDRNWHPRPRRWPGPGPSRCWVWANWVVPARKLSPHCDFRSEGGAERPETCRALTAFPALRVCGRL